MITLPTTFKPRGIRSRIQGNVVFHLVPTFPVHKTKHPHTFNSDLSGSVYCESRWNELILEKATQQQQQHTYIQQVLQPR